MKRKSTAKASGDNIALLIINATKIAPVMVLMIRFFKILYLN